MFDRLMHADWSIAPGKRWLATADRRPSGWTIQAPRLVGATTSLLDQAFAAACNGQRLLIGFDFPIGVPAAYGARLDYGSFRQLLAQVGHGSWSRFFDVARSAADIALDRPFYPAASMKGVLRAELVEALGMACFDDLLRICERRTEHRQAACALFWTLGGNQVGKAALTGWQQVIRPALARGARLWPFDGTLAALSATPGVVLAETYPAEAYRMVGAAFRRSESKRSQSDRRGKAAPVLAWAERHAVTFTADATAALIDGYGTRPDGEDRFDAVMGLLKMIEVSDGRRAERTEQPSVQDLWEGWILGR